ncbi:FAD-dependent oxidoreductase [Leptolyngbya sp. AN02str]|uniref:FAD-dependent oxidoreductase n=1 Tax=Leptolyngbya sp. AN02str TaxID=3423363 RepID=UPI003D31C08B
MHPYLFSTTKMGIQTQALTDSVEVQLQADVLVVGGGPAATWAAWSAATQGAKVVLVDKGYCGTSGAAAPSGNTVWYVPPAPDLREEAIAKRIARSGEELCDRDWMRRVLEQTYDCIHLLEQWGYPFPQDDQGGLYRRSLQGPEYMRLMRKQVHRAGVKILDQSPALELLVAADGVVAGARGVQRQAGKRWQVNAGAVILASGGCAFLSKALGCNVLTGDGYLMAAEAGADLSGMEFSNVYGIVPTFATVTKNAFYRWASFTDEDGTPIEGANAGKGRPAIAKALLSQPVYAQLHADPMTQAMMRTAQPNFFLPFDRDRINPFTQRFAITLRLEGTVRGTGGIRVVDGGCATSVPGLYAAGDAASREIICGGVSGGGSLNVAWAFSSGVWSGAAAAAFARSLGAATQTRSLYSLGGAATNPQTRAVNPQELTQAVQAEVFPYERNLFRHADVLTDSLNRLNALWREVRHLGADAAQTVQSREAIAMLATARWMYATALQRQESRGMHKRLDYAQTHTDFHHRLITRGCDRITVEADATHPKFDSFWYSREVGAL